MVTVIFKLSAAGVVELKLTQPQSLETVLQKCAETAKIELGGFIAIRNGKVITAETLVTENDTIDVFPALSGG
ncbi:MoaD/ThiS family protein [Desulfopila inferna]|uniref:MoaD/ThiS family protein n=1 Tax=Desulfopila inferna TaxID=468528 RepID=UPI0019653B40|nr:MoaD/ThiS family protein [Desulfopila inferna]MBM9602619.1 MoaD/ThiS family protein [Desulfopila inferna]